MSWHIIGTFQCMFVLRTILRDQLIKDCLHIHTDIWIIVLIDSQSTTGMLCEDVDDASLR